MWLSATLFSTTRYFDSRPAPNKINNLHAKNRRKSGVTVQVQYDWAYIFGAVCPARDTGAALVLPYANAEAMNLHLKEISRCVRPGAHAVVTLDGAGWHQQGDRLQVPDNISLLLLPPFSPELNPQENIWQFLRQNCLANRVFDTYEAIVDACCDAWNKLLGEAGRITSIAQRDWALSVNV